jgi:hypothetical protein
MKTKSLHIVIVMIMFLMQIPTAFSQDFSVGGKVGIDLSSFSHWSKFKSDDLKDASNIKHPPKIGLQIGAVGNYTFNEYLALQVELLVQQKGESYKFQEQYLNDTYSNKKSQTVTYITIPILARGNYSFGKFTISAVLGPYIGIGIAAKYKYDVYGESGTEKQKFGKTKNDSSELKLHRFDIGLSFGIIPSYELGPGSIFLDLRYDLGFIDAYNPNTKPEDYLTACNRNFGISVGYLVKLGK